MRRWEWHGNSAWGAELVSLVFFQRERSESGRKVHSDVTAGKCPRLGLIVHHTDAEREYAYDRDSAFRKLAKALDEANKYGWIVIDMKKEWNTVFRFSRQ